MVDDAEGSNIRKIWNVYYHLFLDRTALKLVQIQVEKLLALSASLQSWHDGEYGKFFRICDQGTFDKVKDSWISYKTTDMSEDDTASYKRRFKSAIQKAVDAKNAVIGHGLVFTGFRSAAPLSIRGLKDIPDIYQYFWDHGTTPGNSESLSSTKHPNPMFASLLADTFTLHYGTDPLLGFHLATAYARLTKDSPLKPDQLGSFHLHEVIEAAQSQFRAWAVAFRKCTRKSLTLRFFAGDALTLCHTLQHKQTTRDATSANLYRNRYTLETLALDAGDYASTGDAPLLFNVIDTSNLVDHLGPINVLVAASPLMDGSISATLYTETLVPRETTRQALVDNLLCGNFATISVLLGLFPTEYWTNATAISTADEEMLEETSRIMGNLEKSTGQMYCKLSWKRSLSESVRGTSQSMTVPPIHFRPAELARILHQIYLKMFQHEDPSVLFSNISLLAMQNQSKLCYHRGSLASLLLLVKKRVTVDWEEVMKSFLDLVESHSNLLMGMNYMQELYLQLHLLDVYSVPTFGPSFNRLSNPAAFNDLRAWKDIPPAICLTVKVPRAKLAAFTKTPPMKLGTPIVHCILQASRSYLGRAWQNIFAVVQLAFGKISTSGSRDDDNFTITVTEDPRGWKGESPLLVSFMAPSWVALIEPEDATIAFGVQSTPHATKTFFKSLGLEMNIYKTELGDRQNVYITKVRPNQSGHVSLSNFALAHSTVQGSSNDSAHANITANVDQKTTRIVGFVGRVDIISESIKSALRDQARVSTLQISPCIVAVIIGENTFRYQFNFPTPVLQSRSTCRIARKSSFVEIIIPMAQPMDVKTFPHFMYPLFLDGPKPVLWNMPRLHLDCLPILDTAKAKELEWLTTHTSLMFSARERVLRNKEMSSSSETQEDVRINFKDSLFSMFMRFSGLQGEGSRVFGINHPTGGGVHVLVFISCLRLDLANHTAVLDVAILPLTNVLVPQIHLFLAALSGVGICMIKVNDDELRLWKEILPAWVERCRQWVHRPSCEYSIKSRIPLSTERGQTPICSCGNGKFPTGFITGVPKWNLVSKHAVRAAVSPSFSVPFVEQISPQERVMEMGSFEGDRCRGCGNEKSSSGTNLLTCARCQAAKYCSAECQRADWKKHKSVCGK